MTKQGPLKRNGFAAMAAAGAFVALLLPTGAGAQIAQDAYVKAPNTEAGDAFGGSVAVAGDTMVVGAGGEDSAATGINGDNSNNDARNSGAAYVYRRSAEGWVQEAYLKASNTDVPQCSTPYATCLTNDGYATSVAVSDDTIVVGAPLEDSSAIGVNGDHANNDAKNSGAVYVYRKGSDGNWAQEAYLKASNTGPSNWFGYSVAVSGDTIVVGAELEDSAATGVNGDQADTDATNSGAAYVFRRNSDGDWTQEAYLKASNTDAFDFFGRTVSISGETIAVGAYGEDSAASGVNGVQASNGSSYSGAAYVFRRGVGGWAQEAYIKASNAGGSDYFGHSVSASGDRIVVGAYLENSVATGVDGDQSSNGEANSGAAYVFRRGVGGWGQESYLKASNTGTNDSFGYSVAISGERIVVGAHGEDSAASGVNGDQLDNNATGSGAAYVFGRSGDGWYQQAYLKASNAAADDHFGLPVAVSGEAIVVAAYPEDSAATGINGDQANDGAPDSGAAYVFDRDNGGDGDGDDDGVFDDSDRCDTLSGGGTASGCPVAARTLTLTYAPRRGEFSGSLAAPDYPSCSQAQGVAVYQAVSGRDRRVGIAITRNNGRYKIADDAERGTYYSKAQRNLIPDSAECGAVKSSPEEV